MSVIPRDFLLPRTLDGFASIRRPGRRLVFNQASVRTDILSVEPCRSPPGWVRLLAMAYAGPRMDVVLSKDQAHVLAAAIGDHDPLPESMFLSGPELGGLGVRVTCTKPSLAPRAEVRIDCFVGRGGQLSFLLDEHGASLMASLLELGPESIALQRLGVTR